VAEEVIGGTPARKYRRNPVATADKEHMPSSKSPAGPDSPISPDLYINERDLAMYAAITGKRPTVEIVNERSGGAVGYLLPEAAGGLRRFLAANRERRIAVWVHHVSQHAWKRIDQARLRLAS
jgi:hypothetical protein